MKNLTPAAVDFATKWLRDNPEVPAPPPAPSAFPAPSALAAREAFKRGALQKYHRLKVTHAPEVTALLVALVGVDDVSTLNSRTDLHAQFETRLDAIAPPPAPSTIVPALPTMFTNSKDKYEATLANVMRTLETDGLLSFDEFRNEPMLQRGVVPVPMTDGDYINLRRAFEDIKNFAAVGKEMMRDAVLGVALKRKFDSGIEWLEAQVWDGVPRVERFMSTHFGAEDSEYTRAVGRYLWTGLAGRMFSPGIQLDMVVGLLSPKQGTKKSTGLKALVPDPDWFTDGLSLHEDNDNFKRLIRGKVVVEIAELAGMSKGDIGVIKRVITRTDEKWIEKYQTSETVYPRRCMLFATTNDVEFLPPDETGHRRFLPIEIVELNRALIAADRSNLWAEGAAIFKQSGIAYADAERLAAGRHEKHEQRDVWEQKIRQWMNATPATGAAPYLRPVTIGEVLEGALRMRPDAMDAKANQRAARVLRQLGYKNSRTTVDGVKAMRWALDIPPPPAPDSLDSLDRYSGTVLERNIVK